MEQLFELIRQAHKTYKEENKDHILLAIVTIQAVSSRIMGQKMVEILIKKGVPLLPKEPVNDLGNYFLKLADILDNRNDTTSLLMEMLVFAYKNELLFYSELF